NRVFVSAEAQVDHDGAIFEWSGFQVRNIGDAGRDDGPPTGAKDINRDDLRARRDPAEAPDVVWLPTGVLPPSRTAAALTGRQEIAENRAGDLCAVRILRRAPFVRLHRDVAVLIAAAAEGDGVLRRNAAGREIGRPVVGQSAVDHCYV